MAPDAVVHLIDDDEAVRQALAFLLTGAGFAVRAYDSAGAFLDAVAGVQPGCIVTDVRMPGMSGLELQSRLQESGGLPAGDRDDRAWRRAAGGGGDEGRGDRFYGKAV